MVSRVVGTGLIIAGGDCVSGLEGSFGGLRVGLLALGRVAGPLWRGYWCWTWALVSGRCLAPRGGTLPVPGGVGIALGTPQYGWVGAGPGAGLVALGPGMCRQVVGFLGWWGVRWGGAVLLPCWGGPGWAGVMVGLRPGLLRLV